MTITPYPGEACAEPWRVCLLDTLLGDLLAGAGPVDGRPVVLAVDGRQGGGKTTLAERLSACVPGSVVIHTDDVAWWESFFDWDHLMATGILEPLRRGQPVAYRPPAWEERGRPGAIEIAAAAPLVIVEGVGSSREALRSLLDAACWVQSDYAEANRRGIARDGGSAEEIRFWNEWAAEENPFLAADRPWQRADAIICGTPDLTGIYFDESVEILRGRSL